MDKRTLFTLKAVIQAELQIERIYDITCPANIDINGVGGLSIENHNQWMDPGTIIKCEFI